MSRKRKEREEIEGKATQFFIDGVEVPPEKIARYECRKERNKRLEDGPDDAGELVQKNTIYCLQADLHA